MKQLEDIKAFVISRTRPDVRKYQDWDLNTTMIWIKSLNNGKFVKYCDMLQSGFLSDGIPASELPNIVAADLATDPFNIRSFMDRKKLAQHFKALQMGNNGFDSQDQEGPEQTEYH